MLTQSELAWLERREEMPGYYCLWCPLWDDEADCDGRSPHPFCPIFQRRERLWDALEFSERVAVKLASWEQNLIIPCMETAVCERHPQDCPSCRLKYARLQVEEEMDG